MFDIGWLEMVVIGTVALVVVGPKDLPVLFRSAGQFMAKVRAMGREFQSTMEQAARESGLDEAKKGMDAFTNIGLGGATASARNYARSVMTGETPKVTPRAPAVPEPQASPKPVSAGADSHEKVKANDRAVRKPVTRKKAEPKTASGDKAPPVKDKKTK